MKHFTKTRSTLSAFVLGFALILQAFSVNLSGQTDSTKTAGAWRVELEPTAFISKGYSILASRAFGPKRNLSIGLYSYNIELPAKMNAKFFNFVDDSATIRLNFELALTARYHFPLKGKVSGPYVGLFVGYETFRITRPSATELNTANMFCTPQLGYEFYYFKQLLYINPSVRAVFEFAKTSDQPSRLEEIKDLVFLPSLSLGVRF